MQSVDYQDIIKEAKDCTMKIYFLLLTFFISLSSLASDSLKVKKTEYFEDGKLVRATFFDSLKHKTKDVYFTFNDYYNESIRSGAFVFTLLENRYNSIFEFHFKLNGDGTIMSTDQYLGNKQTIKYDTLGRFSELNCELMYLDEEYGTRICSIDSLEFIKLRYQKGFRVKYLYDKYGNKILTKGIDTHNKNNKTLYKYDSLNRLIELISVHESQKTKTEISYQNNFELIKRQRKEGFRILENTVEKVFENNNKQEIRKEKYISPLKDYRVIGEPKLTFTQENIYENGRIVKIIYEDLLLGKKKVHELKYEFY